MRSGFFIAIEGIEGTGKSTLANGLKDVFAKKRQVLLTREPGGSNLAEDIREILKSRHNDIDPISECLLMFASRSLHVRQTIRPALAAGKLVICDRYVDASYAYQGGGRGIAADKIDFLDQWVCQVTQPDAVILLKYDPALAMERVRQRSAQTDRFEQETLLFFQKAQDAYIEAVSARKNHCIIDASQSVDDVLGQALSYIETLL